MRTKPLLSFRVTAAQRAVIERAAAIKQVPVATMVQNALAALEFRELGSFGAALFALTGARVADPEKQLTDLLKLLNLPGKVRHLLLITNLLTIFETFEDETVAVRSFAGAVRQMPAAHG